MADNLVTVATFGDVTQASFARNALEAAGIKAVLTGEETAGIFGTWDAGLSGVRLMVSEADAGRAETILDEAFPPGDIDEEAMAAAAEAEEPQEDPVTEPPPVTLQDREDDSGMAAFTALFGPCFPPILLYTAVLIARAASGPDRLSWRGRVYLLFAGLVIAGWTFLLTLALRTAREP